MEHERTRTETKPRLETRQPLMVMFSKGNDLRQHEMGMMHVMARILSTLILPETALTAFSRHETEKEIMDSEDIATRTTPHVCQRT